MRIGLRAAAREEWGHDEVMWGIPRRHGYSDIEDPSAHEGITQHAFPIDRNDRAICGNEPPKRVTSLNPVPTPQLALPSPLYNPRCQDCQKLLVGNGGHRRPEPELHPTIAIHVEPDRPVAINVEADPIPEVIQLPPPAIPWVAEPVLAEDPPAQRRKSSRRSVRRGGTAMVASGEPTVDIEAPDAVGGAGIVASVISGPTGIRVTSVTVHDDGRATIALNRTAASPINISWFIVSAIEPQAVEIQQ
jgi:hypothetical protein